MNRKLITILFVGCSLLCGGCSDETIALTANTQPEQKINVLMAAQSFAAGKVIPQASALGDEWIEVDKKIVSGASIASNGSGSTAEGSYKLLNSASEEIVNSADSAKVIVRSIYSHYDIEEPVALSLTWVMRGDILQPFTGDDMRVLNRIYGFSEWTVDSAGVAMALPTGDIYPGVSESMFAVKNPVAAYMAVDGALVEVRASGELAPKDFAIAVDSVRQQLLKNITSKAMVDNQPEKIMTYWNVLQKIML